MIYIDYNIGIEYDQIFSKYDLVDVNESFPIPELPDKGLILIVGSSGSGKSTIIRERIGEVQVMFSNDKPLWKEFSSVQNAENLLIACGLRSIPVWKRNYFNLSNGEKHRAYCAKLLDEGIGCIDEFSSVVDRDTAKSLSVAISRYFENSKMKRLIIATCHRDVEEWLLPNHVYDTDLKQWKPRGCLCQRRPEIKIKLVPCNGQEVWEFFKKHHYLSSSFNKSANSWVALWDNVPVAFTSIISFPSGSFKNAWREHRTVVLPEFQGLGIGNRISNTIGDMLIKEDCKYFSKTSHPSMGEHREKSNLWIATSKNKIIRNDYNTTRKSKEDKHKMKHIHRSCYSHEYIGSSATSGD